MVKKSYSSQITSIEINGLKGRMLNLAPSGKKSKEILLLYGHHSSIERMSGIAENLNDYGRVTIPDLPGFGGMDSFYNIGLKPTVDNYADYLATLIKLKFKNKRFTLVSMSYSFLIVTKMLQKYPDIAKQVDLVVSSVGFVHYDDFRLPRYQISGLRILSSILQRNPFAYLAKHTIFSPPAVRAFYKYIGVKHSKMQDAGNKKVRDKRINSEVVLWQINDVRTRMKTMYDCFSADLLGRQVDLPVHHVYVEDDRFFNNQIVEQHMRIIYKDFIGIKTDIIGHMPSIVATKEDAEVFIPKELKKLLK
ncbi:MAG TPA: alpha/beta hydrolase [Candidatus Saccharimonadales bacterium]|nr:alpha/beta hydrolase [Candidatus Saccharimonadales bacterium]